MKRRTGDTAVDRELHEVYRRLDDLEKEDEVLLSGIELADGVSKLIPHRLGRAWRGWYICNLEGASTTGRIQRIAGEDTKTYVQLQANGWGATITVSVRVF